MKLGGYTVEVATTSLPQKVASGFGKAFENLVGASYDMIAYLGSKVTNGINHAFLATQTLMTGKDIKSVVLVVLNEKPNDVGGNTFSIVTIEPLVSGGEKIGGMNIAPTYDIPEDALKVFNKHFEGFVGATLKPFALLGTQVVHGVAYLFAVESTMVVNPNSALSESKSINIIKIYSDYNDIESIEIIRGSQKENMLGYAFNWLSKDNSLEKSIAWC